MSANTLFLRLEGPLQAWGDQQAKFVIRRTAEAPTKSGIIGMLCAALGVSRLEAAEKWLTELSELRMGVRIDVPGVRWWDYHTVGADMQMRIAEAEGKTKSGAMLSRREYLCDASFLVALQGKPELIAKLKVAMEVPKWTLYLGRKSCVPSRPLLEHSAGDFPDLISALKSVPWRPRLKGDQTPKSVECLLDWKPTREQSDAPDDALVWYDVPISFDPPAHQARFVIRKELQVGANGEVKISDTPAQNNTPPPPRTRADHGNKESKERKKERLNKPDHRLCVFCKSPATTVHHITYQRAGGNEKLDDLRSLCRLCHDAVTMIEHGLDMDVDRINPEEAKWRDSIIQKRNEIIRSRSLETRRRRLAAEDVE